MEIIIKTKNLEITESLKVFVDGKVGLLRKFISILNAEPRKGKSTGEVFVEIERTSKHHHKGDVYKTKILVVLPGKKLMSESQGSDIFKTVIEAKDELEREIKKYKSKTAESIRKEQKNRYS